MLVDAPQGKHREFGCRGLQGHGSILVQQRSIVVGSGRARWCGWCRFGYRTVVPVVMLHKIGGERVICPFVPFVPFVPFCPLLSPSLPLCPLFLSPHLSLPVHLSLSVPFLSPFCPLTVPSVPFCPFLSLSSVPFFVPFCPFCPLLCPFRSFCPISSRSLYIGLYKYLRQDSLTCDYRPK